MSEYPFDTDGLSKGSIVPASVVEEAFGVKRADKAYQLAALRACEFVRKRLRDRGEIVTVVTRKDDIVILTDTEAAVHNPRSFWQEMRAAARAHARNMGVDRAQLSDADRDTHDRNLEVTGRVLAAVRREKRALPPTPVTRNTPLIAAKKGA